MKFFPAATARFSTPAAIGFLFACVPAVTSLSAEGLEWIAATDTEIEIHLDTGLDGDVRLLEIEPYDSLNPTRGLTSERPETMSLSFSREGFLRMTFVDSDPFDPQIDFPEYRVNADFVGQLSMRVRASRRGGGEPMPIRVSAGTDFADFSLPVDGEWHVLRANMDSASWEGMKTLRILPAQGQDFAANADAVLDIDWVAVTYRDDFSGGRNRTGWDVFIDLGVPENSWSGPAQSKIVLPRYDGPRDRLYSKYLLLETAANEQIGAARYVTDLSGLSYQSDSTQGWASINTNNGMLDPSAEGGVLIAHYETPSGVWDPGLRASAEARANVDLAREFAMRYRIRGYSGSESLVPLAVFGFPEDGSGHARFDGEGPADGEWHVYRATLDSSATANPWQGNVRLRLDMPNGQPALFPAADFQDAVLEIDWVALSDDPLFTPGQPVGEGGRVWTFSTDRTRPLRTPAGLKGLSGSDFDDKIDLGIQVNKMNFIHRNALSLDLNPSVSRSVDEFEIGINHNFIANNLRNRAKLLYDNQAVNHIIFLNALQDYWLDEGTENQRFNPLRNVLTSNDSPNSFSVAHNVMDPVGLAHYRGALEYLGEFFSDPSGDNGEIFRFTIGNEVDSHWFWYNVGDIELDELIDIYLVACRIADLALRSRHPDIRIKLSFTHHWDGMNQAGPLRAGKPKEILDRFAERARAEGDFPWALNIHPYPENLRDQEFWNDTTATDDFDTRRITFKNLQVIRRYLQREAMLFQGNVRPITLGEQGFDVVEDGNESKENVQAAALAYSFKIVEQIPDIEAYLYHRQTDHPNENNLLFGLWAGNPDEPDVHQSYRKRPSWYVMRDYGTPNESATLDPYLAFLPIANWGEINLADIRLHYTFEEVNHDIFTHNMESYQTANGVFSGTVQHGDPQIINHNVNTYGDGQESARVRIKTEQAGDWQFFWRRAGDAGFAEARSVKFPVEAGAAFGTYYFDLSSHPDWAGNNIVSWRLDPAGSATSYDFEIDYMIFEPAMREIDSEVSYAAWIAEFDLPEADSHPLAIPAGDGVSNLLKYALNLTPTVPSTGALPVANLDPDGNLVITAIVRSDDADLNVIAEASVDLVDWTLEVIELENVDQTGVPPGFTRRIWQASPAVANDGRMFLRIKVDLL